MGVLFFKGVLFSRTKVMNLFLRLYQMYAANPPKKNQRTKKQLLLLRIFKTK
jgi:hypothetical protein